MMNANMIEPRCLIQASRANLGFRPVSSRLENGFVGGPLPPVRPIQAAGLEVLAIVMIASGSEA